jgi:hypothetical protein
MASLVLLYNAASAILLWAPPRAWDSRLAMRILPDLVRVSSRRAYLSLTLLFALSVWACGGGSSSETPPPPPPPPPTPDFSLAFNTPSVSINAGGSATVLLTATPLNGFSSQVTVTVSSLPTGVTVSPQTNVLTPGTPLTIELSAPTGSPASSATATFTGTSSTLTHKVSLQISVTPGNLGTASTRTQYSRTDAVTEYFLSLNTHWVVYHGPTSRFFVTDPSYNRVTVLDSVTQSTIGNIDVPGAFGIDDSPDHSLLWVGTLLGDVYTIDPVTMKVKQRYLGREIGPFGYPAVSAQVMADGRVALLGEQGGIPSVDGSTSIAIWNPTNNAIVIYGGLNGLSPVPSQPLCPMGNLGGFARSGDRTSLFVGSVDSDGTICQLVESTGQLQSVALGGFATENLFPSPDGNYLVVRGSDQALFFDAHTLTQKFAINLPANSTSSGSAFTFSADSKTLYFLTDPVVYAYNIASGQQIGWLPNVIVVAAAGGLVVGPVNSPNYEAVSANGLLGGPLEEGFGFLDTTQLRTGQVGTTFGNAYLNPATGPMAGGTQTEWSAPITVNAQSQIFIGSNAATGISNGSGFVSVTTPAGLPGPADVYAFAMDGGMQLIPEGFSYGPTILEVTTNFSTAEGGETAAIYGYGFVPPNATTLPSGVSVTVSGQPAAITAFNPNAYNLLSPPFLLQSLYFTVPSGTAGNAVNVSVTSSSGTATAEAALSYLPGVKQFPLAGSSLAQGIYDPVRKVYYFTDASKIQVFSLSQSKWLSPISITPPAGTASRLWGISLSPDGSKLAVADAGAGVVYLIDPASPTSVKTFPVVTSAPSGILVLPAGVAISNSGVVYMTVDVQGGTGFHNFYTLDTNTSTLTDLGIDGPGLGSTDLYLRTAISADNTRAYFNDDGYVFSVDTTTGEIFSATADQGCCYGDYDLTLAPNQTQFEASSYFYDSDLNGESSFAVNDREIADIQYVYGTKFSPDGSLLFQPAAQGIDVYDGRVGQLLSRITLPITLAPNYDGLVSDGRDSVLIAITGASGNGIAVIDLSSLPEPPPLSYAATAAEKARRNLARSGQQRTGRGMNSSARDSLSQNRAIPHITNLNLIKELTKRPL